MSIKTMCDAVTELLKDPLIKANLASALASLNTLLEEANKRGLVEKSLELVTEIQKKLSEVDTKNVNHILDNIDILLEQAKEAKLIEHFVNALKTAKSIGEFCDLSEKVTQSAVLYLGEYGMYVPIIGGMLYNIASAYKEYKHKEQLINLARESNELSAANLLINMQNFRSQQVQAFQKLTKSINSGLYDNVSYMNTEQLRRERDFAMRVIQAIPILNTSTLEDLKILSNKMEKLLSHFVEPEIKNETLQDVLDNIGASAPQDMPLLLNYVVYSSQSLPYGRPEKPEVARFERTYNGLCNYYGKEQIDLIMKGLVEEFVNEGGNDLYYALANSFENAPNAFIQCAQYISLPKEKSLNIDENNNLPAYINKMSEFYHHGAEQYIDAAWKKTLWPKGLEYLKEQIDVKNTDSKLTIDIIIARAFLEYCHKTSSYFFGYHYVARDIGKGLLDIPTGLINTVYDPRSVVTGVCNLFTLNGWANIGTSAWNRPLRFASSLTPGLVIGGCASFHDFTPTVHTSVHAVNTIRKAHLVHQVNIPLSTLHTSLVNSQSIAMVSSSAGTVNTLITKTQNSVFSDTKPSSNETKIPLDFEQTEKENKIAQDADNIWVLLLPDLKHPKTAMEFYEMLCTLSLQLEKVTKSCDSTSITSHNRFFSLSRNELSKSDNSLALVSTMHYNK